MYNSIMEAARNSTFKNPFMSTVHCDASSSGTTSTNLVPGRTIAAAATAEGGTFSLKKKETFSLSYGLN